MKILIFFILFGLFQNWVLAGDDLKAVELKYFDSDWDNKIDTIEIKFNTTLTWSFVSNNFAIDSDTGWLSEFDIKYTDSRLGLNKIWEIIDWNILSIAFDEYEKTWTWLVIDNTWTSHLRLKTYTDVWISDLYWNVMNIWLWDEYVDWISYWSFFSCDANCVWIEIANNVTWFENHEFKIPLIVKNFNNIWWFEIELNYDKNNFICSWVDSNKIKDYWSLSISSNEGLWVLNLMWDYWTDSALTLQDDDIILEFNCISKWNIWDTWSISVVINEIWDNLWNKLNYSLNSVKNFSIQENLIIWWEVKNINWELFSWWKLILENRSISLNNVFSTISDNIWYVFSYLIKGSNYDLRVEASPDYTDDLVDVWDVIKIQRYIVWVDNDFSWYDCAASDINQDNKISVLDIIKLRRYLAWIEDLSSWNLKFYSNDFNCGSLSTKSEKIEINNFNNSLSGFIFTKVRMWNIE